MMQRWIFALACYCISGCSSVESLPREIDGHHMVPFRMVGHKIPMIQAKLNSKPAWFIVDTGASITLLNATERAYFDVAVYNSRKETTELSGFTNRIDVSSTSVCRIEIGKLQMHHKVYISKDMDGLFAMIEKHEQIRVAGILGSDILAKYLMNVNYGTRTLSYNIK